MLAKGLTIVKLVFEFFNYNLFNILYAILQLFFLKDFTWKNNYNLLVCNGLLKSHLFALVLSTVTHFSFLYIMILLHTFSEYNTRIIYIAQRFHYSKRYIFILSYLCWRSTKIDNNETNIKISTQKKSEHIHVLNFDPRLFWRTNHISIFFTALPRNLNVPLN